MTNRILSTGQRIFTPGLHTWPWDSSASERSARRAKKHAPSSWLCKVANDRAEIRELLRSSCRNSWHVTLRKNLRRWTSLSNGKILRRSHVPKAILIRSLRATKGTRPIIWSPKVDLMQTDRACKSKFFYEMQFTRNLNS